MLVEAPIEAEFKLKDEKSLSSWDMGPVQDVKLSSATDPSSDDLLPKWAVLLKVFLSIFSDIPLLFVLG